MPGQKLRLVQKTAPGLETNGVKQGCVMAPTLFSMMFSAMPWMLFRTVTLVFQSGTVLMAIYSTLEGCKPKLRCRLMCQMSSSVQIIWIRMPAQRQKCKEPWIKSHSHVITMISQSAQRRQRLYTNQHLENRKMNEWTKTESCC